MELFDEFFEVLPKRASSECLWSVPAEEIKAKNYDLKAVNPNRKQEEDIRMPQELLSVIEAQEKELSSALIALRSKGM